MHQSGRYWTRADMFADRSGHLLSLGCRVRHFQCPTLWSLCGLSRCGSGRAPLLSRGREKCRRSFETERAFVRNGRGKPVRGALVIERQSGLRSGSVSRFGRSARTACCSRGNRRLDVRSAVALVLPSPRSVSRGRSVHCMSRQSLSCPHLLLQKRPQRLPHRWALRRVGPQASHRGRGLASIQGRTQTVEFYALKTLADLRL
jgi:hypothetical protein